MKAWITAVLGAGLFMVFVGGCAHACVDTRRSTYGATPVPSSGKPANWAYFEWGPVR